MLGMRPELSTISLVSNLWYQEPMSPGLIPSPLSRNETVLTSSHMRFVLGLLAIHGNSLWLLITTMNMRLGNNKPIFVDVFNLHNIQYAKPKAVYLVVHWDYSYVKRSCNSHTCGFCPDRNSLARVSCSRMVEDWRSRMAFLEASSNSFWVMDITVACRLLFSPLNLDTLLRRLSSVSFWALISAWCVSFWVFIWDWCISFWVFIWDWCVSFWVLISAWCVSFWALISAWCVALNSVWMASWSLQCVSSISIGCSSSKRLISSWRCWASCSSRWISPLSCVCAAVYWAFNSAITWCTEPLWVSVASLLNAVFRLFEERIISSEDWSVACTLPPRDLDTSFWRWLFLWTLVSVWCVLVCVTNCFSALLSV